MKYISNILYFFLLSLLTIWSCTEESTTLEIIDDLVIQGYLQAGKPVDDFKVTKIISLAAENSVQEPVNDAVVRIDSEELVYELVLSDSAGVYQNLDLIPEAGKIYRLEVQYQDKVINAETFVPDQPQEVKISEEEIFLNKIEDFTDLNFDDVPDPLEVSWQDEGSNYYFVSVANIDEDPEIVNELFGGNTEGRPELVNEPEVTTTFFINTFQFITHFGNYEVKVFRVNPEYVTLYESVGTGQGALNEVTTNVKGGFGIFTGINSTVIPFVVKKK